MPLIPCLGNLRVRCKIRHAIGLAAADARAFGACSTCQGSTADAPLMYGGFRLAR